MSEPTLAERELAALQALEQLVTERARTESEIERSFRHRREDEERAFQANRNRITTTARTDTSQTKAKYQATRDQATRLAETETQKLEQEYAEAKKKVNAKVQAYRSTAKKKQEETRWQALAVFEAGKDNAIKLFKQHEIQIKQASEHLDDFKTQATPVVRLCERLAPKNQAESSAPPATDQPIDALTALLQDSEQQLATLSKLFLPKFLAPQSFIWPFLILALGLTYPLGTRLGWGLGAGVAFAISIGVAVAAYIALSKLAAAKVGKVLPPLKQSMDHATQLVETSGIWAKASFEKGKDDVEARRAREAGAADEAFARASAELDSRRDASMAEIEAKYPPLIKAVADRRDAALKHADEKYPARLNEINDRFQRESTALQDLYKQQQETTNRLHAEAWNTLVKRWHDGLEHVREVTSSVRDAADQLFLDWNKTSVEAWAPPTSVPASLRFGELAMDLADIPQGIPADSRLKDQGATRYDVPALIPFPRTGSVLIRTFDAGKAEAVKLLQTLMLRYSTSIPPGKVRFTIVDPVGLGENFAAFMHLADYHELLVTNKIWTETAHIEQRLADLSAHMENVIQKYLRNEFETIEAYNAFAGEVAEPFRVLVVANFPANFSEAAARRLVSIATTGARCGVYTLISLDTKLPLPTGVQLKDIEPFCINFQWRDGTLHWREPNLSRLPLTYDSPPNAETFTKLMHKIGELARNANRVEVPFEFIAPTADQYWKSDSRAGVDIPLGRAGATKLQHLKLGKGTSQHVLIAGKTGSGKSTLLHAVITNAALRYSPDEVELYLIDFKKGVEFKVYAAMELPHARVIAVESEREFGLSVLQRLDVELKARGDRFRELGVQDLSGFREADGGKNPMPRILLIVDEFQEFFVEDDKIAQEVALLLDRLVRQGRAFGIHVNLGSQSLGGAYSLARSTIGQMAVRIALQCSESDAHLILSEENSAARLLTRPGEAIYNDANGMVEGNNFFQVVWLSDERREHYLRLIRDLAISQKRRPAEQIVFEGNLPAVASKNHLLAALLQLSEWPEPPKADMAWLGEAIAIKDPTAAVFRPQSGANVLIVGQNDEMALGIFMMSQIALAGQHDPATLKFVVLDGSPADSAFAGKLGELHDVLPHRIRAVTQRDLAANVNQLAAEIARRQHEEATDAPLIYVFIFDIQRFRDLRKSDDDFGFGRYGEPKAEPASKLFGTILRDGPPVGVHTMVWCDSLNNLNRTFDRQTLREFEMRVLFQMSGNDSSTLIDSPVASRLGPNRALYFSEEEGRLEKFRPYGIPEEAWLKDVREKLHQRPQPEIPAEIPAPPVQALAAETADSEPPPFPSFPTFPS